jgi:hypothetical protein
MMFRKPARVWPAQSCVNLEIAIRRAKVNTEGCVFPRANGLRTQRTLMRRAVFSNRSRRPLLIAEGNVVKKQSTFAALGRIRGVSSEWSAGRTPVEIAGGLRVRHFFSLFRFSDWESLFTSTPAPQNLLFNSFGLC